jgi:hypothetical protein
MSHRDAEVLNVTVFIGVEGQLTMHEFFFMSDDIKHDSTWFAVSLEWIILVWARERMSLAGNLWHLQTVSPV